MILNKEESEDTRVKFNLDYNNNLYEQGLVKYIFNSFIREEEQEKVRDSISKIIINPVMPIKVKKGKLNKIIGNIVNTLFLFKQKPEIFAAKKTKKCYKLRTCDEICQDEGGSVKIK